MAEGPAVQRRLLELVPSPGCMATTVPLLRQARGCVGQQISSVSTHAQGCVRCMSVLTLHLESPLLTFGSVPQGRWEGGITAWWQQWGRRAWVGLHWREAGPCPDCGA